MAARLLDSGLVRRTSLVCLCSALVSLLDFSLRSIDSQLFGFLGLMYLHVPTWCVVFSYGVALLPSLWMPIRLSRPSQVIYWLLYLMVVVPMALVAPRVLQRDLFDLAAFVLAVLACFASLSIAYRLPCVHIRRPKWARFDLTSVHLAVAGALSLIVWSANGFSLDLGLSNIYARRHEARDLVAQQTLMAYLKGNLASAVQPFAFAASLALRSTLLFSAAMFAGVVVFSLEGSKTSALLPLFVVGLLPLVTWFRRSFGIALVTTTAVLVALAVGLYQSTGQFIVPTLTTWRLFQVKGLLTAYYWDFFSVSSPTLLGDGILQPIVGRTYELATPRLIGLTYFGSDETNSNANVFASAFADFGYWGLPLVTLGIGVVMRLLDSFATNRSFLLVTTMAAFIGMKWTDTSFDTSLLTHGVLVTLVLIGLWGLPEENTA